MKHTDIVYANGLTGNSITFERVNSDLTEHDIISLQDIFLINGLHAIHLTNQAMGRTLINNFLQSLPMYTRIGCLTLDDQLGLPADILDIYAALYNEGLHEQAIEEFFINEFYFDFAWIEISETLLQAPWYGHFCKIMEAYSQKMPIVRVYFKEINTV